MKAGCLLAAQSPSKKVHWSREQRVAGVGWQKEIWRRSVEVVLLFMTAVVEHRYKDKYKPFRLVRARRLAHKQPAERLLCGLFSTP